MKIKHITISSCKRIILPTIFGMVLSMSCHAQLGSLQNKKVLQMPVEYIEPSGIVLPKNADKLPPSGPKNDWIVYSDRDNNPTYASPGGIEYRQINFMESFYVVEEKNEFLRLVKCKPGLVMNKARKLNVSKAEDYGWIKKDKLLLWKNALFNKQANLSLKALTVRNPEALKKGLEYDKKQFRLFKTPELKNYVDDEIELFEFLFIFKKEKDNYLVGAVKNLNPFTEKEKIGWISGDFIQVWQSRLCIEPNTNEKAVEERKNAQIKAYVFNSYEAANKLKTNKSVETGDIIWDKDSFNIKHPTDWWRFPVITKQDNDIYRIGVIVNIFDGRNHRLIPVKKYTKLERDYRGIKGHEESVYELFIDTAYVQNKPETLTEPLFDYLYLLTDVEVYNLIQNLEKFSEHDFQNYHDDFKSICRIIIQDRYGQDDRDINDKWKLNDLISVKSGLPNFEKKLSNVNLTKLINKKKTSDEDILQILTYLEDKLNKLKDIWGNPEHLFRSGNHTYYWIPLELIP